MKPSSLIRYMAAFTLSIIVGVVAAPLIVFVVEAATYKPLIAIGVKVLRPYNSTHLLVLIEIAYNGSIPLHDVTVYLKGKPYHLGSLGPHSKLQGKAVIPMRAVEEIHSISVSFRLADIYNFNLTITP